MPRKYLPSCLLLLSCLLPGPVSGFEPPSPEILHGYLQQGRYAELEAIVGRYQAAYEAGERDDRGVARVFRAFRNSASALEQQLTDWVKNRPESYAALVARGVRQAHLGWLVRGMEPTADIQPERLSAMRRQFQGAANDFARALELNPRLTVVEAELLRILHALSLRQDVADYARSAIAKEPRSFLLRYQYAWLLLPAPGESLESLRAIVDSESRAAGDGALKGLQAFLPYVQAELLRARGKTRQARARLDEAVDQGGEIAFFRLARARYYYSEGKYRRVLRDVDAVLEQDPHDVYALLLRGRVHWDLGRMQQALADFSDGLELDPLNPRLLYRRSLVLGALGRIEEALGDLARARRFGGHVDYIWGETGRLHYLKGSYTEAAEAYRRAAILAPTGAPWFYYQGLSLYQLQDCGMSEPLSRYVTLCEAGASCDGEQVEWADHMTRFARTTNVCQDEIRVY